MVKVAFIQLFENWKVDKGELFRAPLKIEKTALSADLCPILIQKKQQKLSNMNFLEHLG